MRTNSPSLLLYLLILSLTFSFMARGMANPYHTEYIGEVDPPLSFKPPIISINSPANDTIYTSTEIPVSMNISNIIQISFSSYTQNLGFYRVYYNASWLANSTVVYSANWDDQRFNGSLPLNFTLRDIPQGVQEVEFVAVETGLRETFHATRLGGFPTIEYGGYALIGTSTVKFTIDSIRPEITDFATEDTYKTTNVTMNVSVNKPACIIYNLDGQGNITISSLSLTLLNLQNGQHNLTVYAQDEIGRISNPKTVYFNVNMPEAFPAASITVIVISVAVLIAALTLIRHRRRHQKTG